MKFHFTLLFVSLLSLSSFAGNEGGGGGVVVCRDADGKILNAELLDLFEAPLIHGIPISKNDNISYLEQLESRWQFAYAPKYYSHLLIEVTKNIMQNMKFLPDGVILEKPLDIGEDIPRVMKQGCQLEGLGFYTDSGNLLVSKSTFEYLSETDKAAFFLHEAIYFLYREYQGWEEVNGKMRRKKTDSYIPRHSVGHLMASSHTGNSSSHFFLNNIVRYDDMEVIPLVLSKRVKSGMFRITFTQNKPGPLGENNQVRFQCTDYSKYDVFSEREWGLRSGGFSPGTHYLELQENNGSPLCRGLTIWFKHPFMLDELKLEYDGEVLHLRKEHFEGESLNGFRFELATEQKL